MKPPARITATIDLLTLINEAWEQKSRAPADGIIGHYFRQRRYIGSKDRGAISELVYFILRHGAVLEWWLEKAKHPVSTRAIVMLALVFHQQKSLDGLEELFSGGPQSPSPLTQEERALAARYYGQPLTDASLPLPVRFNYPDWMTPLLQESLGEAFEQGLEALNREAPVDLRVNTLKATRQQVMQALTNEGYAPEEGALSPLCVRLPKRGPIFATPMFQHGWFEVQDEGSQLVAAAIEAKPGEKVIDFCAGAGGKTLAIAAGMENRGRILAWDTNADRLGQMPKRLARAGVSNVQIKHLSSEHDAFVKRHKQTADWVLVDAPCTGSGTWRRSPDLKWRTAPKDLEEITALQKRILASAARLVKPGGVLLYATCSLFADENNRQVEQFLSSHKHFALEAFGESGYWMLLPHRSGTDGFFIAKLRAQLSQN